MDGHLKIDQYFFSTAFGRVAIRYRQQPFSVVEILLPQPDIAGEMHDSSPREPDLRIIELCDAICGYFTGIPIDPHWDLLEMTALTPLQQQVLRVTAQIPFGKTRSYADIAKSVNRPGGARFVGNTMARNPFPILIPCHRVIRSDGIYGKFGGGRDLKKRMIALEAAHSR